MKVVLRNFASLGAMRALSALLTLLLLISISRNWGLVTLGKYSLLLTVFLLFQALPLLGLNFYVVPAVLARPGSEARHASNLTVFSLLAACVLSIAVGLGGRLLYSEQPDLYFSFWLIGLSLIPTGPILVVETLLSARQRMDVIAKVNSVEGLTRTGLCLLLVHLHTGLSSLFAVFLFCRIGAIIFYLYQPDAPRIFNRSKLSWVVCRSYLRRFPRYLGILLFSTLISRLDILFLSRMVPPEILGRYAIPARLYDLGQVIPQVITIVFYPRLAKAHTTTVSELNANLSAAVLLPLLLLLPAGILIETQADRVLSIFGGGAGEGAQALALLMLSLTGVGLSQMLGSTMLAIGRPGLDLTCQMASCVFALFVLPISIRFLSINGAAGAILATTIFANALRWFLLRRLVPPWPLLPAIVSLFVAALAMITLIHILPIVVGSVIGVITYAAISYYLLETKLNLLSIARSTLSPTNGDVHARVA